MIDKLDAALRFHQSALNLRAHRQQLIASNIANADTPNFKARDFDFAHALGNALGMKNGALTLSNTSTRHLPAAGAGSLRPAAQYRTEAQSSVDGNTVSLDTERAAFAENAVQYEASVTFVSGMLRTLQSAISGQ